jgi:uncharacterized protein YndB with AHSA1/START domain
VQLVSDRRYPVAATPDVVWSALTDTGQYQRWWPWLREFEAKSLEAGDEWRCRVRPPLPYTVRFTILLIEVEAPRAIGARIEGDIDGTARVELAGRDGGCEIRLTSALSPRGRVVRLMADVARPLARRGHDWVLDTGARQFAAAVQGPRLTTPPIS